MEQNKGFYQKYTVIDNRTGETVTDPTFTLNLGSDRYARQAALHYAHLTWNRDLLKDLQELFAKVDGDLV